MLELTTPHHTSPAGRPAPGDKPQAPAPPPPPSWRRWLLPIGLLLSLWLLFGDPLADLGGEVQQLSYTAFVQRVDAGKVKTADISSTGSVTGELKGGTLYQTAIPTALDDQQLAHRLERHDVQITALPASSGLDEIIVSLVPLLLFVGLFWWLGRRAAGQLGQIGGVLGGIGQSRAKVFDAERPTTRFADVAGYAGVKQEIVEVVDFLKAPDRYRSAGAVGPRGVLMVGPPGTGKTLLARAVAGEADVPFLSVTGSSFVEMFVGVGAARVRDLFTEARKRSPAIVFIDEVDAIGQRRAGGAAPVSNDEREQTLNQLLAEMDGFQPAAGVVVLAATNRPETLDPALLRPGRFDRQITVPLPTQADRRAILAVHVRGKQLEPGLDLDFVARATPGFSGADLANLVNEAAIHAVRDGRDTLTQRDFDDARDRIILGRREGSNVLLPDERRAVAVHEAGHALVAVLSDHADPVAKVTILPAGVALGVTEQLPVDERHLYPESYMRDSLAVRLGGRAAELVVFGEGSTGASNDLAGATQLATRMVREFGLSPELGPVGYSGDGSMILGGEQIRSRPYAEATQRVIDSEVARLLREAEDAALVTLRGHVDRLDALADLLLEHETIDGAQVYELVGRPIPGGPESPLTATHRSNGDAVPAAAHTTMRTEDSHV
jgi:cell division protease FtsH